MIQLQALSWIITNEDLSLLTNYGISRDHFFKYQKEFDFIIDHYSKYNKVPDLVTFADRFPEVQIFRVKETPAYLAKALQEQFIWLKKLSPLLKEAYELGQKNSFEAVDKLRTALDTFQSNPTITAVDILHNTEERLETIKKRQTESQFIPTGFPEIDNDIIGLKRGEELCTILARTNTGKSWFGMKLAENGPLKLNLDVGFYSGEMDIESQTFRFDTLFSNLNNTDLVQGDVNLERYKEYLEQLAKFKNHFYITTPQELGGYATVPKLEAFVNKYNLQYLVVDQLSLVEDARAQKGQPIRKTYDNICMDLFRLSTRYKIPVVLMCQANRKSLEKGPKGEMAAPGEGSASESDAIEHHSSKVLSLFRKEDTLEVTVVKNRHGSKFHKYLYAIDYGHGTFKYIPTVRKENDSVQQRSVAEVNKDKEKFSKDKGSLFG